MIQIPTDYHDMAMLRRVVPAAIAQLGERQTEDLKVPGSIPGLGIFARPRHMHNRIDESRWTLQAVTQGTCFLVCERMSDNKDVVCHTGISTASTQGKSIVLENECPSPWTHVSDECVCITSVHVSHAVNKSTRKHQS